MKYTDYKGYKKGFGMEVAQHDENNIKGFFGEYRWLSNFHLCPVKYEGLIYPSSENAYQAAKVVPEERYRFLNYNPMEAKTEWKKLPLLISSPKLWDAKKNQIMFIILFDKFNRNNDLKDKLLTTGDKYLEETNWWRDSWWGYDINMKEGENHLGKMIMEIREFIKIESPGFKNEDEEFQYMTKCFNKGVELAIETQKKSGLDYIIIEDNTLIKVNGQTGEKTKLKTLEPGVKVKIGKKIKLR